MPTHETQDQRCVAFLQWALPQLNLRWRGFRKPRRQVCRRLRRRYEELGLDGYPAYRRYLADHPDEWAEVDARCRVTISRFFRDRRMFDGLGVLLEELQPPDRPLRIWSAGCASGEEPYSVVLAAEVAGLPREPEVIATDRDPGMIARARRARYPVAATAELDEEQVARAFAARGDREVELRSPYRDAVRFSCEDVREWMPEGPMDLVLCRNLAFTYFAPDAQRQLGQRLSTRLRPGGALIIGSHESLPDGLPFEPWPDRPMVHRRRHGDPPTP